MIRETTMEAYKYLIDNELLGASQLKVWHALTEYNESFEANPTASELARFMQKTKGAQSNQNVVTRLGELRDRGMAKELPKRPCTITETSAYTWYALAEDSPLPSKRKKTAQERINELMRVIEIQRSDLYEAQKTICSELCAPITHNRTCVRIDFNRTKADAILNGERE